MSKKNYESEITQFLKQYQKDHPDAHDKQLQGRARLWDKQVDTEAQEQFKAARVAQQAYVYQTK